MPASPYYAPTYFPPSFFYLAVTAVSATPTNPTTGTPYNAPSYFPPSYFYGNGSSASPVPTPVSNNPETPGRDQAAYAMLLGLIRDLGIFEEVIFGAALQRNQAGAACYPLAVLTPKGWEESDDSDPVLIVRRVRFGITIVVQSQDGQPQFDQLNRLSSAILKAVDFQALGSLSLPPLTRIRSGLYDSATHYPEQSLELEGEFSLLIDPQSSVFATH
jgi:hypothetical protein